MIAARNVHKPSLAAQAPSPGFASVRSLVLLTRNGPVALAGSGNEIIPTTMTAISKSLPVFAHAFIRPSPLPSSDHRPASPQICTVR